LFIFFFYRMMLCADIKFSMLWKTCFFQKKENKKFKNKIKLNI